MRERLRRLTSTAAAVLCRPRASYRAVYRDVVRTPTNATRFARGMECLGGLDLSIQLERGGTTWLLEPSIDEITAGLFLDGTYSGEEIAAVVRYIDSARPGRTWVIDVGANIGTTTVPFAQAGYQVLAIEPLPSTLRYLRTNVETNGLRDRVRILEAAISDTEREVVMAVSPVPGTSEVIPTTGVAAFETAYHYTRRSTIRVPAVRLADAAEGIPGDQVAVVWSDTQGCERDVIASGSQLWAGGVPLYVELWPRGLDSHGGVDAFVQEATEHFTTFMTDADLAREASEPRPVEELGRVPDELETAYTNVLLVP